MLGMIHSLFGHAGEVAGQFATIVPLGSKTYSHRTASTQSVSLTNLTDRNGNTVTLAENDLVVVALAMSENTDLGTTLLSGFTAAHAVVYPNSASDVQLRTQYKVMGSTPDTSLTAPANSNTSHMTSLAIMAFRGVDPSNPMDVVATTASAVGAGPPNSPSITPATAGALIVAAGGAADNPLGAITIPSGADTLTNHFASAGSGSQVSTITSASALALFSGWTSGAYDPAAFGGGNTAGTSTWAAATLALRPATLSGSPPSFSVNPSITSANGFYANGDTLTGVPGTHNGLFTTGYQWKRDGVAIGGATGFSYTLTGSDLGTTITFTQVALNASGSTTGASSGLGPIADPTFQTDTRISTSGDTRISTSGDTRVIQTRIA